MEAGRQHGFEAAYVGLSPGSLSDASIAAIDRERLPWLLVVSRDERYLKRVEQASRAQRGAATMKKHVAWHRSQKDTWTWASWSIITGPETDRLCTGTFDHKWEDFDKPFVSAQADRADALLNRCTAPARS